MAIKQLYVDTLLDYMQTIAKSARVTINGALVDFDIFKTIVEGNTIKHLVYLTNETGSVTNAYLLDAFGRELQSKSFSVNKGEDGFTIVFVTALEIKGE